MSCSSPYHEQMTEIEKVQNSLKTAGSVTTSEKMEGVNSGNRLLKFAGIKLSIRCPVCGCTSYSWSQELGEKNVKMRCDFGHCWELDYSTFANACWHEERDRKRLDENENYNRKSLSTREVEMKPHKINIPEGTYFEKYSIPFPLLRTAESMLISPSLGRKTRNEIGKQILGQNCEGEIVEWGHMYRKANRS